MTIQDVRNILMVSRCGSINKAAGQIPMTQPALSRCIQKVERELQVHLFHRKQGGQISLTKEGEVFLRMGEKMLEAYGDFERFLEQERDRQTIHLGLPPQMSYSISEGLLQGMYTRSPQHRLVLHPLRNDQLIAGLEDGSLDYAILRQGESEEVPAQFHFALIKENPIYLALRSGSCAGKMAEEEPDTGRKTLDLKHLRGEKFVANLPGSNSRQYSECILEKAGIPVHLMEMANFNNRMDMVRRGEANCLVIFSPSDRYADLTFYDLPREQSYTVLTNLACKKGREGKRYFQMLLSCLEDIFKEL